MLNVTIKAPQQKAKACVIWMHGLGADGKDMEGVAHQLPFVVPVRHVFIDAPVRAITLNNGMSMRAWYDIRGMKLTDREDKEGICQSEQLINDVILQQIADGFEPSAIFLAGFSQGGAMALFTALRQTIPLAGVISLSAYLPLALECNKPSLIKTTPIFIAAGRFDPIVLPDWTKQSLMWLRDHDFQDIAWHDYPMEHSICFEEIRDLAGWITLKIGATL